MRGRNSDDSAEPEESVYKSNGDHGFGGRLCISGHSSPPPVAGGETEEDEGGGDGGKDRGREGERGVEGVSDQGE